MLPFLKDDKKIADVISASRKPDEEKPSENEGMLAAAHDLLAAIASKDASAVASALQAAFELADSSEPEMESDE